MSKETFLLSKHLVSEHFLKDKFCASWSDKVKAFKIKDLKTFQLSIVLITPMH